MDNIIALPNESLCSIFNSVSIATPMPIHRRPLLLLLRQHCSPWHEFHWPFRGLLGEWNSPFVESDPLPPWLFCSWCCFKITRRIDKQVGSGTKYTWTRTPRFIRPDDRSRYLLVWQTVENKQRDEMMMMDGRPSARKKRRSRSHLLLFHFANR